MFKTTTLIFQEIFPGQFEPSKCHKFIRLIEDHGKLLRNYTQNIDTLEQVAGITRVIQCHGKSKTLGFSASPVPRYDHRSRF